MSYDNEWPLVLPGEEVTVEAWMRRDEAENPGMSGEIPF